MYNSDDEKIEQVTHFKYLGVTLDCHLQWDKHIDTVVAKAKYKIMIMRKNKAYVNKQLLKLMYIGLIRPCIEYCGSLFTDLNKEQCRRLEGLQNDAMGVILGRSKREYGTTMRTELKIPTLESRRKVKLATVVYKSVNGNCTEYLHNALVRNVYDNETRSKGLILPKCKLETYKRSYEYQSVMLWNALSDGTNTANIPKSKQVN